MATLLAASGLLLNAVGAVLLAIYAPFQPSPDPYAALYEERFSLMPKDELERILADARRELRIHRAWMRRAFALIAAGFLLQLAGLLVGP